MRRSKSRISIPTSLALAATLLGLVEAVFVGHALFKDLEAQRWPTTKGTVLISKIVTKDYTDRHNYHHTDRHAEVRYRYLVNDRPFESENLNYNIFAIGGTQRLYAPELASQYPVGTAISVSYDPKNPARAVSDPSFGDYSYRQFIGGILIFLLGAWYLATHKFFTSP